MRGWQKKKTQERSATKFTTSGNGQLISFPLVQVLAREGGRGLATATRRRLLCIKCQVCLKLARIKSTAKKFFFPIVLCLFLSYFFLFYFYFFLLFCSCCFISLLIIFSLWCFGYFGQRAGWLANSLCVYVPHYGSWQFNFMYWSRSHSRSQSQVQSHSLSAVAASLLPTKHLLKSFASIVALLAWGRLFKVLSQAWQGTRTRSRIRSRSHIRLRIRIRIRCRILICTCLQFTPNTDALQKPLMRVSVRVSVCKLLML